MPSHPEQPTPDIVYLMAALIAAVKTARFDHKEFQGMQSPRFRAAVADSLILANCVYLRAVDQSPH